MLKRSSSGIIFNRKHETEDLIGVPLYIQCQVREGCSSECLRWEKRKVLVRDGSSKAAHDTHGRVGTFTARWRP